MNLDYKYLLEDSFDPASRVWIYQSSRLFTVQEALAIEKMLHEFVSNWKSHGAEVKGAGYLFFGQFIVLMADEKATGVSGCSTDSSVRLVKNIEQEFGVNMFDRNTLAFYIKDRIQLLPFAQVQYAIDNGYLQKDSLYFNNLVQTKTELENRWIQPLEESWLQSRVSFAGRVS
jgi:hypothetical protein